MSQTSESHADPRDYSRAPPPGAFRIQAKRLFLTYPQSDFDLDVFLLWLDDKFHVDKAVACKELHQTGEHHVHATVEFTRKISTRNAAHFDYRGRHPNVGATRNWGASVNYLRMDSIEVKYFKCTAEDATVVNVESSTQTAAEVCRASTNHIEWMLYCLQKRIPFGYSKALWDAIHDQHVPTYTGNIPMPEQVTSIHLRALQWVDDYRAVLICGPSGIGKTSWAIANAPVPFLYVTDPDDLRAFDPLLHKSIVFDEVRCTGAWVDGKVKGQWPLTQQIKLCTYDTPVSIRCRYANAKISARVPKIFTCTDHLMFSRDPQIERRIQIVNLYTDKTRDELWFV